MMTKPSDRGCICCILCCGTEKKHNIISRRKCDVFACFFACLGDLREVFWSADSRLSGLTKLWKYVIII